MLTVTLLGLVGWLRERSARPRTPTAQELSAKLENVGAMTGGQFEVFVADVLRARGYQATILGGSGDQGVDIIAVVGKQRVAIQCKNYKKPVGNRPVQEVFAGAQHHRCSQRWVVAPAGFTKGAVQLAQSVGVMLFDANSIREWIRQADQRSLKQAQGTVERVNNKVGTPPTGPRRNESTSVKNACSTISVKPESTTEPEVAPMARYDKQLESCQRRLETLQRAHELRQGGPLIANSFRVGSPAQKFWSQHIGHTLQALDVALQEMVAIERRHPGMIPSERVSQRAELTAKYSEIKKQLGAEAN